MLWSQPTENPIHQANAASNGKRAYQNVLIVPSMLQANRTALINADESEQNGHLDGDPTNEILDVFSSTKKGHEKRNDIAILLCYPTGWSRSGFRVSSTIYLFYDFFNMSKYIIHLLLASMN